MRSRPLAGPGFCGAAVAAASVLVTILVFRAFLLPNTLPVWIDQWRDVTSHHLGFGSLLIASRAVCVLAAIVWSLYYSVVSKDCYSFGQWLSAGALPAITSITVMISTGQSQLVASEVGILLGYVSGLAVARAFRSPAVYVTALITCGAVQSVAAIVYQSRGIHTLVSGTVVRAGGTFGAPSELYMVPVFILPFAVQRILSSTTAARSAFYMLCGSSMLAALVLTWDRSGFAATCIGLFWLVRASLRGDRQLLGFAIVLVLMWSVFFVRSNGPVNYSSSMRSIHGRSALFESGVLIFSRHWLNGVGVGYLSLPVQATIHGQTENIQMAQPYNQPLYWLDEMGVFGGVLIVLFVTFIFRSVARSSSSIARAVGAAWISVLVAGLFNTLFGCYDLSCGNMLIGSLLGITMRLDSADGAVAAPAVSPPGRVVSASA